MSTKKKKITKKELSQNIKSQTQKQSKIVIKD